MWTFLGTLTYVLFWLACIVSYTIEYLTTNIQVASFSQVIYTLTNSMGGSENTIYEAVGGFFVSKGVWLVLGTALFIGWLWICRKRSQAEKQGKEFTLPRIPRAVMSMNTLCLCSVVACASALGMNIRQGYEILGIGDYLESQNKQTMLYEDYYADPAQTAVQFPEQKRNLIMITMESMESTFTDTAHGGGFEDNLIPELYDLAKTAGTDFSYETADLNGAYVANNTGWTIAGLVAQSAGIPLNAGNAEFNRNFDGESRFLPYITTLGDILKANGYNNYFMCGSDASFAGRRNYYEQHGDYKVYDLFTAREDGIIPEDYYVWWGYEDARLFDYAKQELGAISSQGQPFNFSMLTVDTHFTDGYLCPDCPDTYERQYENVIACSDHRVVEFVKWLMEQPFYENTTIVLTGDHCSMDAMVPAIMEKGYQRRAFTAVLNGPEYTQKKTRLFTTLDLFPTILESINAQIDGHRLGLGTSLYADEQTLSEMMTFEEFNRQISWTSEYYNTVLMAGDESRRKPAAQDPAQEAPAAPEDIVPISAQEYQEVKENFTNPDYVYTPPVQEPSYYDPYYPPYTGEPDWGGQTPGTDTPVNPGGNEGTGGDGSGQNPGGGDNTGGENPTPPDPGTGGDGSGQNPGGGDNTGGDTPTPPDPGTGDNTGGGSTGGGSTGGNPGGGTGGNPGGDPTPPPVTDPVAPAN